jgi:hypothetical protein
MPTTQPSEDAEATGSKGARYIAAAAFSGEAD